MMANERATRSRRLNVRAYKSRENAVIVIPAVRSWLRVRSVSIRAVNIEPVKRLKKSCEKPVINRHYIPGFGTLIHKFMAHFRYNALRAQNGLAFEVILDPLPSFKCIVPKQISNL